MTLPLYGTAHRARIVSLGAAAHTYNVVCPAVAPGRSFGPISSTVDTLAVGDRVILIQVVTTRSDLVIIGRVF
jgi:hypothetical protein